MRSRKAAIGVFVLLYCMMGCSSYGFCDDVKKENEKALDLGDIFITASGIEQPAGNMAASTDVITREQIETMHANSSTDAISYVPGIFIHKTGAFGRTDVVIRGLGDKGTRIMIMVDGRPEKMSLFGCTVTHCLPLDNVEKIEVIRGPASVLYGSDALGGVINIITRKAEKPFEGSVSSSYGSFDTYAGQIKAGGKEKAWDYYATADYRSSDGYTDNSSYYGEDYTGRLGYQISDTLYSFLNLKYFQGKKYEPLSLEAPPIPPSQAWNEYKRGSADISLIHKAGSIRSSVKLYRDFGDHEFSDGWDSTDYTNGLLASTSFPLFEDNTITVGGEAKEQAGELMSQPRGEWDKSDYSLYLHDEQIVLEKVILTGGVRHTEDEIAGGVCSWDAGLVYHLAEKTLFRLSAARGFRLPQISELYLFPIANSALKEETVDNYEAGVTQELLPGVTLDLSVFRMEGDDLIELANNPLPPPLKKNANTGSFVFEGGEVKLNASCGKVFSGYIAYSRLDVGEKTTGRPGDVVDVFVMTRKGDFYLSGTAQYVSDYFPADNREQPIDSYVVFNTKLVWNIRKDVEISLAVDNIFDKDYVIYADLPSGAAGTYTMPPRTYTAGLKYSF